MRYTEIMVFIRRDGVAPDEFVRNLALYVNSDKTEAVYKGHDGNFYSSKRTMHISAVRELLNNTHKHFRRIS